MPQLIAHLFKFIALLVLYMLPSLLLALWFALQPTFGKHLNFVAGMFGGVLLLCGLSLWVLLRVYQAALSHGSPFSPLTWRAPWQGRWLVKSLPYLLVMLSLGWLFELVMTWIEGVPYEGDTANQEAIAMMIQVLPPVLMVLNIVVYAPIGEELLFRGIFTHYFAAPSFGRSRQFLTIAISSLLFGAMHLGGMVAIELVLYALMGVILSTLYWHSRDIRYPIVVHMINNAIGVAALYFEPILT